MMVDNFPGIPEDIKRRVSGIYSSGERGDIYSRAAQIFIDSGDNPRAIALLRAAGSSYDKAVEQTVTSSGLARNYEKKAKEANDRANGLLIDSRRSLRISPLVSKVSAVVATLGIIGGLFFVLSGITGRVIQSTSNNSTGVIGGLLFLIGIIGCWVYLKNK